MIGPGQIIIRDETSKRDGLWSASLREGLRRRSIHTAVIHITGDPFAGHILQNDPIGIMHLYISAQIHAPTGELIVRFVSGGRRRPESFVTDGPNDSRGLEMPQSLLNR